MKHLLVLVLSALTASVVFAQPYTADRHLARKVPCQACHVTGDTSVPVRKQTRVWQIPANKKLSTL